MEKPALPPDNKLFKEMKPPSASKMKEFLAVCLKLLLGICLLPAVYASSACFGQQLYNLEGNVIKAFVWGIVAFVGFYFFVWEPAPVFKRGFRILEIVFQFFSPLVKFAPYALPIYTILIFLAFFILSPFMNLREYLDAIIFLAGFTFALHVVYCAKTMRTGKEAGKLKSGYIFGFSVIYILDMILMAFFFNLAFEKFSFLNFFNSAYHITKNIYIIVFRQLFL